MTKKLLFSTLIATSFSFAAGNAVESTTARLDALGLSNAHISDFSNIWDNAAKVLTQKQQVYGEFLNQSLTGMGGAIYRLDENASATIGVFFNRTATSADDGKAALISKITGFGAINITSFTTQQTANRPKNQIDILYGRTLNTMDLGVRLSYASDNLSQSTIGATSVDTSQKASHLELEAGVVLKEKALDATIAIGFPKASRGANAANLAIENGTDGAFTLSTKVGYQKGAYNFVAKYALNKYASKNKENGVTTVETFSNLQTALDISAVHTKKLNDTTHMYTSIGYQNFGFNVEFNNGLATATVTNGSATMHFIPVVAAIETQANERWTLRGSASTHLLSIASQENTSAVGTAAATGTKIDGQTLTSTFRLNAGAGYVKGNYYADTVIAGGFTAFNVLANLSAKLSMGYHF